MNFNSRFSHPIGDYANKTFNNKVLPSGCKFYRCKFTNCRFSDHDQYIDRWGCHFSLCILTNCHIDSLGSTFKSCRLIGSNGDIKSSGRFEWCKIINHTIHVENTFENCYIENSIWMYKIKDRC